MGIKYIWQEPARASKRRFANKTNENARRCTRKITRNIGKNNKRGKRRTNLHNIIRKTVQFGDGEKSVHEYKNRLQNKEAEVILSLRKFILIFTKFVTI